MTRMEIIEKEIKENFFLNGTAEIVNLVSELANEGFVNESLKYYENDDYFYELFFNSIIELKDQLLGNEKCNYYDGYIGWDECGNLETYNNCEITDIFKGIFSEIFDGLYNAYDSNSCIKSSIESFDYDIAELLEEYIALNKGELIEVAIKRAGEDLEFISIENELEEFQELVEGCIEVVNIANTLDMIINDEGKIKGLEPNMVIAGDLICGDIIFVDSNDEGDFESLSDENIELLKSILK